MHLWETGKRVLLSARQFWLGVHRCMIIDVDTYINIINLSFIDTNIWFLGVSNITTFQSQRLTISNRISLNAQGYVVFSNEGCNDFVIPYNAGAGTETNPGVAVVNTANICVLNNQNKLLFVSAQIGLMFCQSFTCIGMECLDQILPNLSIVMEGDMCYIGTL